MTSSPHRPVVTDPDTWMLAIGAPFSEPIWHWVPPGHQGDTYNPPSLGPTFRAADDVLVFHAGKKMTPADTDWAVCTECKSLQERRLTTQFTWQSCDDQADHAFDPGRSHKVDDDGQAVMVSVCEFTVLACHTEPSHLTNPCRACLIEVGQRCEDPGRGGRSM